MPHWQCAHYALSDLYFCTSTGLKLRQFLPSIVWKEPPRKMPKRPSDSRKTAVRRAEHSTPSTDLSNSASDNVEAPPRPRMGRPPSPVKRVSTSFNIRPEHSENLRLGALLRGPGGTQ